MVGEDARGGKPSVVGFGRVNAIGGGRAAHDYRDPSEPSQLHRRKPFSAPNKPRRRSAFTHLWRTGPRATPNSLAHSVFRVPALMGNSPIPSFWSARDIINQI